MPTGNSLGVYTNSDGTAPVGGLVLLGNTLYGTAGNGGSSGYGTVFAVNTDSTGFTNMYSFTGSNDGGAYPRGGPILSGNTLYGTTGQGGANGSGAVFALNTDGTGFTNLHSFAAAIRNYYGVDINSAGAGALISSGNTLYGTTTYGGRNGNGTVFALNTDGTGFTNLYSFTATMTNSSGVYTNGDGANPFAALILSGNTLYGTAGNGGSSGYGTVFAVNMDSTGFTNMYSFTGSNDGRYPRAGLILSGNALFGTTLEGGANGGGTVFSLSLGSVTNTNTRPQLRIGSSVTEVILSWPTDATGFTLQSTTNLASPVWTTVLQTPVVVSGQNTVTNPVSGTQQFFRLSQ